MIVNMSAITKHSVTGSEDHPEAAREIRENPRAVLWQERGRRSRDRDNEDASTRLTDRQRRSWEEFLMIIEPLLGIYPATRIW